jgi:hypothetical protein
MDKKSLDYIISDPHLVNEELAFKLINFFYSPTSEDYNNEILEKKTKKEIHKAKKELDIIDTISMPPPDNSSTIEDSADFIVNFDKLDLNFVSKWIKCFKKNHEYNNSYLEKIEGSEIDYLIICEAPPLKKKINLEDEKYVLQSKYVFNCEDDNVGKYRIAPYDAIYGISNPGATPEKDIVYSASSLIELFVNNKVAFIDIISFPLPLNTDLRTCLSNNMYYSIEQETPRLISFMKMSFDYFFKTTECKLSDKVKIAFMMPPTSGNGIKQYFQSNLAEINTDDTEETDDTEDLTKLFNMLKIKDDRWWEKALVPDKMTTDKDKLCEGLKSAFS